MMKKLLVLLLSIMMAMSLIACGGDDTTVEEQQVENDVDVVGDEQQDVNDGAEVLDETAGDEMPIVYAAFGNDVDLLTLTAYAYSDPADLAGTSWLMAGGRDAGVEQAEEEHVANMQGLSGVGGFQFEADGYVVLLLGVNAEGAVNAFEGSYEINENGAIIVNLDMQGTGYPETYVCTVVDGGNGTPVLVAYSDDTLENCIYMVNMAAE